MTIYLSSYSTFDNTQELNHHVTQHLDFHSDQLNTTQIKVFQFISRYSVKYAGACHLKNKTIADAIDKNERTVRRILSKLESLSIIERTSTTRKKTGGSGANIITILPFMSSRVSYRDEVETLRESKSESSKTEKETTHNLSIPKHTIDTNTVALKHSLPESIYQAFSPFFNVKELYQVVGTLFRAKASIDSSIIAEDHVEYLHAFYSVIRRYKQGHLRNLNAYLYKTWKKVTQSIFLKNMEYV